MPTIRSSKSEPGSGEKGASETVTAYPRESGPRKWVLPTRESGYARLAPHDDFVREAPDASAVPRTHLKASTLRPDRADALLADVSQDLWLDRLAAYKRRKGARMRAAVEIGAAPHPGAAVPGAKNWSFIGPSLVMKGQAWGEPAVAGRVSGIAVAAGGKLVYAASANGGVFRSDDGGVSWRSLMDAFDVDPTNFASSSLACGAIAIDPANPNRIYVGTGEGDTYAVFNKRVTHALPAYRGIGPIRSDDGGATWQTEKTAAGSPMLAGKAFFSIAVDPRNGDNVVAATTEGLFQRTASADGPCWVLRANGTHSSVVVGGTGAQTRFFSACWGDGVYTSPDGSVWSKLQTGFPDVDVGRIALAVNADDVGIVYAMVSSATGLLAGIFRLEEGGAWTRVDGPPDVLPASDGSSQGDYDLAIAVDPLDPNTIYLGGSYFSDNMYWPASIWRCQVGKTGAGYKMTSVSAIGKQAHADVHVLTHSPGNPDELWTGCDGGVFINRAPRGAGAFQSCNVGLACLCTNFFAQDPTDPAIVFCGLQDNGTARSSGTGVWTHVTGGDGGYCLINWRDPKQVLVFANGTVYRATDGGVSANSWSRRDFPWAMMTEPIVGAPYEPANPAWGDIAAVAAGSAIYLSKDFGQTWSTTVALTSASGGIFSMTFASATLFYVGTTDGAVVRFTWSGANWDESRIDNVAAGALPLRGLVADIATDWSDKTGMSVYIAFGGIGDYRHVWHFDGTSWGARSGSSPTNSLLDVEHNALVVDRQNPGQVYVGADIGVWHSSDGGTTWEPLPNGLPDAPVFDLQIHPTRRLLRATTHGRGLFEYTLQ